MSSVVSLSLVDILVSNLAFVALEKAPILAARACAALVSSVVIAVVQLAMMANARHARSVVQSRVSIGTAINYAPAYVIHAP